MSKSESTIQLKPKTYVTRDMYKDFKKDYPHIKVTYKEFRGYISEFNKRVVDEILKGEELKFPFAMGSLRIKRVRRAFKRKQVDFGETRKLRLQGIDKIVYFTDDYWYRWYWRKKDARIPKRAAYSFRPSGGPTGNRKKLARLLKEDQFAYLNFIRDEDRTV